MRVPKTFTFRKSTKKLLSLFSVIPKRMFDLNLKRKRKMLENRPEDALVKLVKTVETLETVENVNTVEIVETVETAHTAQTARTAHTPCTACTLTNL